MPLPESIFKVAVRMFDTHCKGVLCVITTLRQLIVESLMIWELLQNAQTLTTDEYIISTSLLTLMKIRAYGSKALR